MRFLRKKPAPVADDLSGESWRPALVPAHIAIIMDGNGRWAKKRHLPRIEGHRNGAKTVRMAVEEARRLGVKYLTLFAFSTENWKRPAAEVGALMGLFTQYLASEIPLLNKHGIRLRGLGNIGRLPEEVQSSLKACEEATSGGAEMELIVAVSYGGREEIVEACKKIATEVASGKLAPSKIDESLFSKYLYAPTVPDPDLLIRTSDENRISNFLLWELAYSEIVVSSALWPEFSREEFRRCIQEFSKRERRFGLTGEQASNILATDKQSAAC